MAVLVEGATQAEAARRFGVSKGWVSKLVAAYRTHGPAAFEPRSRRPRSSPNKTPQHVIDKIVSVRDELTNAGLDAGPETIQWHLQQRHNITVSTSTIRRYLIAAGRITAQPNKRPRSAYIRFQADLPNGCWQSDVTHYHLGAPRPDQSNRAEILTWLDDHSRFVTSLTVHLPVTAAIVVSTAKTAAQSHGLPASILTDNAMIYTTRFATGRGGRNALEAFCVEAGIEQKHSRPAHPTTCGKVERFQQTLKNWLRAQPNQPATLRELQDLLDTFTDIYNNQRPHRSLNRRTPATAYRSLPKDQPTTIDRPHYRIRHDIIDTAGRVSLRRAGQMHHIGIGRAYKHTRIVMIINDLDITIINAQTSEVLRKLTLDPSRDYQPQNNRNP